MYREMSKLSVTPTTGSHERSGHNLDVDNERDGAPGA